MSVFSAKPFGGGFWAIGSPSDDDDKPPTPVGHGGSPGSPRSLSYLCKTPGSVACDLVFDSMSKIRRREEKIRRQREMAIIFNSGRSPVSSRCVSAHDAGT